MVSTPEAGQPALTENHEPKQANWVAAGALIGAGLASACCVVPLLLVMLGISGAWIANLTALEPFRPVFIGAALVALFFAWRRIWRPAVTCRPGEACALPQVKSTYKALFWMVAALVAIAVGFPYIAPWFY